LTESADFFFSIGDIRDESLAGLAVVLDPFLAA
jgi:hypothetical protein